MDKLLLDTLNGRKRQRIPIWLMRQAGRYLPEYRALRTRAASFLDFCYTPELAVEATLQPIRRYGLDAAILFSDILVIPDALGQRVGFVEGEGPLLEPLRTSDDIERLSSARAAEHLAPVYRALELVRAALPAETAMIGFAGAPFTLATYMIEGRGGTDHHAVKGWAYREPESFQCLIDLLVGAVVEHLCRQVEAGAEIVQLFDSWAGVLPEEQLFRWSVQPMIRIAEQVRGRHPGLPVIAFPRAVGPGILMYRRPEAFAALSLDTGLGAHWASQHVLPHIAVQGNLDPVLLLYGGAPLEHEVNRIIDKLGTGRFVFNLGHGVLQQTPPKHVAQLVDLVRRRDLPSGQI